MLTDLLHTHFRNRSGCKACGELGLLEGRRKVRTSTRMSALTPILCRSSPPWLGSDWPERLDTVRLGLLRPTAKAHGPSLERREAQLMGHCKGALRGGQWAVAWGAGQASSKSRTARAPGPLTEAPSCHPRSSRATTGLLGELTSVVCPGSELPCCPSVCCRWPGQAWVSGRLGVLPGVAQGSHASASRALTRTSAQAHGEWSLLPTTAPRVSSVAAHLPPGFTQGSLSTALPLGWWVVLH